MSNSFFLNASRITSQPTASPRSSRGRSDCTDLQPREVCKRADGSISVPPRQVALWLSAQRHRLSTQTIHVEQSVDKHITERQALRCSHGATIRSNSKKPVDEREREQSRQWCAACTVEPCRSRSGLRRQPPLIRRGHRPQGGPPRSQANGHVQKQHCLIVQRHRQPTTSEVKTDRGSSLPEAADRATRRPSWKDRNSIIKKKRASAQMARIGKTIGVGGEGGAGELVVSTMFHKLGR